MAIVETSVIIKYKDSNGNMTFAYPVTSKDYVSGMDEIDNHLVDKNNPHDVTPEQIGALSSSPIDMTSSDGVSYTATVPGITALTPGISFIGLPSVVSTSQSLKLTVNGLTTKYLRRRVSLGSGTTASGYSNDWIAANKPIKLIYDGTFWIVDNLVQANANDLMGTVPIEKGGTGATTASEALTNLGGVSQETFDSLTITRSKLADDTLYSPMSATGSVAAYSITANDLGKTIAPSSGASSVDVVITLPADVSASMPYGAEIAILYRYGNSLKIQFESGAYSAIMGDNEFVNNRIYQIPKRFGMVALKKVDYSSDGSKQYWLVTGNVGVVE